jgi:histidine triad (HIT) family protein
MEGCIFCAIASHREPASILYEDELSLAFLDVFPIARGHSLVIPKQHYSDLYDLTQDAGKADFNAVARTAKALRAELAPDGMNVLQSNGRAAGQTIFHFHFHIVPRWSGDKLFLPPHAKALAPRSELDELAAAVSGRL